MEYNQPETRFQSKITVSELNEAGLSALNRFLICVLFYLLKKNGYFHLSGMDVGTARILPEFGNITKNEQWSKLRLH